MLSLRRMKLTKLNEHLVCVLCNGYFVEATTITECLHTFCRACIVKYLERSSFCPVCEVQVHKTKPISGLREDKTLQDIVFKLVPNLFRNEMKRRSRFYAEHPEAVGDRIEQSLKEKRHFFHVDDLISLSLEFLPPAHAHAHALGLRPLRAPSFGLSQPPEELLNPTEGEGTTNPDNSEAKTEEQKVRIPMRRYLRCPAAAQIRLLEKFIRLKYNLTAQHRIDIVHAGDCLSPELTLLDVVYMYKWAEDDPLKLQYTVIAPPLPLRKRPRVALCKEKDASGGLPKKAKIEKSSTSDVEVKKSPSKAGTDLDSGSKSQPSDILKMSTDEKERQEKEPQTQTCNSLNSSRDDGDDAMVIDESASVDMSGNQSDKETSASDQSSFTPISAAISTTPLTSLPSSTVSSIESLKFLVNKSDYSSSSSKPNYSSPKLTGFSNIIPHTSQNLHKATQPGVPSSTTNHISTVSPTLLSPQIVSSQSSPSIKPNPEIKYTTPHLNSEVTTTSVADAPKVSSAAPKLSVQDYMKVVHSLPNGVQKSNMVYTGAFQKQTQSTNSTSPTISASISKPGLKIPISQLKKVCKSSYVPLAPKMSTATGASTGATNAIRTPLISACPTTQEMGIPSSIAPAIVQRTPLSSSPRSLISNSYRANMQMTNGVRMNGMVSQRPIFDPTRPRLGRPPKSLRISVPTQGSAQTVHSRRHLTPDNFAKMKSEARSRPKPQTTDEVVGVNSTINPPPTPQQILSVPKVKSASHPVLKSVNLPQSAAINKAENGDVMKSAANGVPFQNTAKANANNVAKTDSTKNTPNGASRTTFKSNNSSTSQSNLVNGSLKTNSPILPNNVRTQIAPSQKAAKSPGTKSKAYGSSNKIMDIAESLVNKQLKQLKNNQPTYSSPSIVPTTPNVISTASAALTQALTTSALGLPDISQAFQAAYMADYAAVHNLLSLSQAAARMNLVMNSLQDPSGEKSDAAPIDLSPTNKGAPNSSLMSPRQQKAKKLGTSVSAKNSALAVSPKTVVTCNASPKPSHSPAPASKAPSMQPSSSIAPPTAEVTITKLPNASSESSPTATTHTFTSKPAHTNTVSITKRPTASTPSTGSKFPGVNRSPSNASVRQIPNPSLLSHSATIKSQKPSQTHLPNKFPNNNNNNTVKVNI